MRFKLAIYFSGKLLETREFDKDIVTLGRSPKCDIIIDNLGVSRVHSQIERNGDVFILRDMKSNNGTFVHGEKIQRYNLNHQDEFFLGKHSVIFYYVYPNDEWTEEKLDEDEDAIKSNMQELTMSMDANDIAIMGIKKQTSLAAYLTLMNANGIRQNVSITQTAIFFGASPKCDYPLEGWFISKRHVLLLKEETGFRLIHLGVQKPPKINGIKIDNQKLKHGDVIDIENIRLVFNIGNP
ncbi:MAG: FHA domain-containing protein [Planctomycetes bacterium]|jgi:pSer/pThr/pTyr-binding forkhead associated (FHA) protein|nr:FHA domain-containing protein [Planctomycetota bacterium]HON45425.1 FHA domain-containing protein [Planctomycetota bacterium]HPY74130.1 FHA domain-containing protein [Planctomycetota bacterium]HQA99676.1 FHA domain-containing protein [Planctomycetota bacterium]HRU52199.1 FHA domain-containing protein [Planctomycetota bacterium]